MKLSVFPVMLGVMFGAVLLLTGCTSTVIVDGVEYQALSKSQINHLVVISRAALQENLKKELITRQEYRYAMRNEPSVRVQYRGDRFGTATVSWRTGERLLEFRYDEDLTGEIIPKCSFATSFIPERERGIRPDKSLPGR
ncbi:MAG: hypothetical protein J6S43_02840 [Lentisphaeria bacterium]|nr:hypothetical protein [Lentisphaeria bacterium]